MFNELALFNTCGHEEGNYSLTVSCDQALTQNSHHSQCSL